MKAFTVFQPYAFAIVAGLKGYETRPRRTNIRGRVAVHAAKRIWSVEDMEILYHLLPTDWPQDFGAVIGTVEIADCVPVEEIVDSLTASEKLFGDYSPGRFAWVLKDPVRFEKPIPARGNQGWWNWEEPAEGGEAS